MRLLACLQANRAKIGAACNKVLVSHGQCSELSYLKRRTNQF